MTIPDFGEARFLLRRGAPEAAARWQASREAVEEAWRNGAEAALARLSVLEEQIESLARDPHLRRSPAARDVACLGLISRDRSCVSSCR